MSNGQNDAYYGRTPAHYTQFNSNAEYQTYLQQHQAEQQRQEQQRQQQQQQNNQNRS